jgi:hypothetical protein
LFKILFFNLLYIYNKLKKRILNKIYLFKDIYLFNSFFFNLLNNIFIEIKNILFIFLNLKKNFFIKKNLNCFLDLKKSILKSRIKNYLKKKSFLKNFFLNKFNINIDLKNKIIIKNYMLDNVNIYIKNNNLTKLRKKKIKKTFLKKSLFNFLFFLIKKNIKEGKKLYNLKKIYYIFFLIKKILIKKSFVKLFLLKFFLLKKIYNKLYIRYKNIIDNKYNIIKKIFSKNKNILFFENIFFIFINILKNKIIF